MTLALVVGCGLSFAVCGVAWGTTGHVFADQFGGLGVGDGQFGEPFHNGPAGIAVMPSTGEVFTADQGSDPVTGAAAHRVQRFDATGVFQAGFPIDSFYNTVGEIATDSAGAGTVYVVVAGNDSAGHVLRYSTAGVPGPEIDAATSGTTFNNIAFGQLSPLAVDPADGTVYVAATDASGLSVVDSFDESGAFVTSFDGLIGSPDGTGFCSVSDLAVDSSHNVYVLDPCKNRVDKYSAAGTWLATVDDGASSGRGAPSAVTVDPASGEVYVAESGPVFPQVTHFNAGGTAVVYSFEASQAGGIRQLAVGGTGVVYISDSTKPFVERYVQFAGPTVTTDPPSSVDARAVTLNGTINPEGVLSSYHFEYGIGQTYGTRTPEVNAGSGSVPAAALAAVTGLRPNTTYHFRIVGSNASGSISGPDQPVTTSPAPADVGPAFASEITPRSARIHGSVNPNSASSANSSGVSATYFMEYGTSTAYGQTTGGTVCFFFFGCVGDDVPVAAQLSALEPGTTYHFRVTADNGTGGLQLGADQTFITAPAAGGGATGVTTRRATLTGTINAHGMPTTYHFNFGQTSAYGASTPEVSGGAHDGDQLVSQSISGLLPDTTYHVQVVARTGTVTRAGGDGLFRTAPAPTAVAISPIDVSTGAGTLAGKVDTYGLPGTYRFDVWSLDSSYLSSTADRPVSGNASAEQVTVPVDALPPGETFVVQLSVASNDATTVSDLVTFSTASRPRVFPLPPAGDGAGTYGCSAPHLDSYNARPKPGETIAIHGQDLGTGGTVSLGDRSSVPTAWSQDGFKLDVPEDASGTLPLTVNCGHRSNTIAVAIFQRPDNRFSITMTAVTGSTAALSITLPGPGRLTSSAVSTQPTSATIKRAGKVAVTIKLNVAGARALRRSKDHRLKIPLHVRFVPAGGQAAVRTAAITFKRTNGR